VTGVAYSQNSTAGACFTTSACARHDHLDERARRMDEGRTATSRTFLVLKHRISSPIQHSVSMARIAAPTLPDMQCHAVGREGRMNTGVGLGTPKWRDRSPEGPPLTCVRRALSQLTRSEMPECISALRPAGHRGYASLLRRTGHGCGAARQHALHHDA
jgi:hypothetical protein